jgi:hypothetical protein
LRLDIRSCQLTCLLPIVGIAEDENRLPGQIVAIKSRAELKTTIAASIATNISPTPPYEIAECTVPGASGLKLAAVRVRQYNGSGG